MYTWHYKCNQVCIHGNINVHMHARIPDEHKLHENSLCILCILCVLCVVGLFSAIRSSSLKAYHGFRRTVESELVVYVCVYVCTSIYIYIYIYGRRTCWLNMLTVFLHRSIYIYIYTCTYTYIPTTLINVSTYPFTRIRISPNQAVCHMNAFLNMSHECVCHMKYVTWMWQYVTWMYSLVCHMNAYVTWSMSHEHGSMSHECIH